MACRVFEQFSQTAATVITSNNTATDISGLTATLPTLGQYRINYSVNVKIETALSTASVLSVVSLIYNVTTGEYFPVGRGEVSTQFGSEINEDLVSGERSITKSITKSCIISVISADVLNLRAMYIKPTTDDATVTLLYNNTTGTDGTVGYFSYEKMTG